MDASQYKDYVLVLLFIKYVSDGYAGAPFAPVAIPEGAGFRDLVALKGRQDIGDQINKKIVASLANANKLSDMPDFNDPTCGSGSLLLKLGDEAGTAVTLYGQEKDATTSGLAPLTGFAPLASLSPQGEGLESTISKVRVAELEDKVNRHLQRMGFVV